VPLPAFRRLKYPEHFPSVRLIKFKPTSCSGDVLHVTILIGKMLHVTKGDFTMPTSVALRVQKRRTALRMAGLRPIQIWVPDTRGTGFAAECLRQSALAAKSDLADTDMMNFIDEALDDVDGWNA